MKNSISLGLRSHMVGVPQFLWHFSIGKIRTEFLKISGSLTPEQIKVLHHCVAQMIEADSAVSPASISEQLGISLDAVNKALDRLERKRTFLVRNVNGSVEWAFPGTMERTPHLLIDENGRQSFAA